MLVDDYAICISVNTDRRPPPPPPPKLARSRSRLSFMLSNRFFISRNSSGTFWLASSRILINSSALPQSERVKNEIDVPLLPARPVLPTRCSLWLRMGNNLLFSTNHWYWFYTYVNVFLDVTRKIIIDHICDILDINATRGNVCCN